MLDMLPVKKILARDRFLMGQFASMILLYFPYFPNSVSLGSSAIAKVSEQVGAAKIRIPKVPSEVPKQGSQEQVPKVPQRFPKFPRGSQRF